MEEVEIEFFNGTKLPDWLVDRSYSNIGRIVLFQCRLSSGEMPMLGRLPSLKYLSVSDVGNLKRLGRDLYDCNDPFGTLEELHFQNMKEWEDWEPSDDAARGICFFPLLEKLRVSDCRRLKGRFPAHLPSLKELFIHGCRCLIELNVYPQLVSLEITKCGPGLVNLCLDEKKFHMFPSLRVLVLGDCDSVESFPAEGSLRTTLTSLSIKNFTKFKMLDVTGLQSLICLEELLIFGCPMLEALPEDVADEFPSYTSLTILEIEDCVNLKSLNGNWLQSCSSLHKLSFSYCPNLGLQFLPNSSLTELHLLYLRNLKRLDRVGLLNLTSLRVLYIITCPNLEALPEEGIPRSLEELWLFGISPNLKDRCQQDTGADWPKIAHIPRIFTH